jgi:hypothetical protein
LVVSFQGFLIIIPAPLLMPGAGKISSRRFQEREMKPRADYFSKNSQGFPVLFLYFFLNSRITAARSGLGPLR